MKLHPRHDQVARAGIEIAQAICDAASRHEITYAELVSIMAAQLTQWTKSQIREDRNET